ncbi:MAG TPA: 4'-phosphopantetheinyl transferase superfamily protein [Polyangiaceae bacterium]|nr:4'-phosphopantetheinyl transferase superfamily protein [Polyangiaceae bacterium]
MPATRLLPTLFSTRVASFEVGSGAALTPLFDSEEPVVAQAVEKRKWEFRAGRHCARSALGELGLPQAAIPSGPDRAPLWPAGVVGSITHTGAGAQAYAAAVVARAREVRALGLDAERAEPLAENLEPRVLTAGEQAFVGTFRERERGLMAMLHFSAKEAFYKCQYPLTQRFLGFHDVEVTFELERNRFRARLHNAPENDDFAVAGQFVLTDDLIVTGIELGI